ncbi:MAG: hypothetical protein AAF639_16715 [Chloroflexota bacterium]
MKQLKANLHVFRDWLPSKGNMLFTILVMGGLLLLQNASGLRLLATPYLQQINAIETIAYQGRLADTSGDPLTDTVEMSFRLYATDIGGSPLWTEQWAGDNSIQVNDGLFNVMLGSLTPIDSSMMAGNSNLFLGVTVGADNEMTPRVQLGSVPFAMQALTVPDASITREKLSPNLFEHFSASTTHQYWPIPECNLGSGEADAAWTPIPGLTFDITLDAPKTVWLDFSGLGTNIGLNQAVYANIFVDGTHTKLASGKADLSGCRNSDTDTGGDAWCSFSNVMSTTLEPGTHTIEARAWCDGSDGNAIIYGGTLRGLILP